MNAYIYRAALYCEDCTEENWIVTLNPEGWASGAFSNGDSDRMPQGPYADGGGEADTPQHCGSCHVFLENPLTDDGRAYVRDAIERFAGGDDDAYAAFLRERDGRVADEELDDIAEVLVMASSATLFEADTFDRVEVMLERVRAARKGGA